MGVYNPRAKMPNWCGDCDSLLEGTEECEIYTIKDLQMHKRNDGCPLIEIDLEKDIPTIWYNRQTRRYEPKGTKQEVYERLYKLKNGERRSDENSDMDNSDNRTD